MSLFKSTIGHQLLLQNLEKELKEKKLSHASLFSGPEHVGKWHVAMRLAKGFFCSTACGHCNNCQWVQAGTHPDVSLFLDDGQSLKIDAVRQLIHTVNLSAYSSQRCILIEHLERMPTEAQNAFLKTLEEPAGNCFFILTACDLNGILPTLISRVREYRFSTVTEREIEEVLIGEYRLEKESAQEIVQLAQGRPGLAVNLLQESDLKQSYQRLYHQTEQLFSQNNLKIKMQWVENLEKDPEELKRFFEMGFYYLRKTLYQAVQVEDRDSQHLSLKKVSELFESLFKTRYLIKGNVNKRLALENFFLKTEN